MKSGRISSAYLTRRKGYPVLVAGPREMEPGDRFFDDEIAEIEGSDAGSTELVQAFNFEIRRVHKSTSRRPR
jgi:hypothetical protein